MANFSLELEVEGIATLSLSDCGVRILGCQYTPVVPEINEEEIARAGQSGGEVVDVWFPNVVETCLVNVANSNADDMLYIIDFINYLFHYAHERQRLRRGPKMWLNYIPHGAGHEVQSEILRGRVGMPGQPLSPMLGGGLMESLPVVWKRRYYWEATSEYTAVLINTGTGAAGAYQATVLNHSDNNPTTDENWVYTALNRGTLPVPVKLELENDATDGSDDVNTIYVAYNVTSAYDTDELDSLPHWLEAEDATQGADATAKTVTADGSASGGGLATVDDEQGTLSFPSIQTFKDTGQDFTNYVNAADATHRILITKDDDDVTWGYGRAIVGGDETVMACNKERTIDTTGFNGDAYSSSTPDTYIIQTLEHVADSEQGNLSFPSSSKFADDGQDFSDWETSAPGTADYMIHIIKDDGGITWGYIGPVVGGTSNQQIFVYQDKGLTTLGFNGDTYSQDTPHDYDVTPVGEWVRYEWTQSTTSEENTIAYWTLSSDQLDRMDANWFRILAKFWTAPSTDTYQVKWKVAIGNSLSPIYETEWVELTNGLFLQEMGSVQLPPSVIAESYYELRLVLIVKVDDTGAKQLDLDYLQLSPLDGWRVLTSSAFNMDTGVTLTDDMHQGQIYTSGWSQSGNVPNFVARGSSIMLSPLHNTMLYFLWRDATGAAGINWEMNVTVKYYPRSLYPYIYNPEDFP